GGGSWPVGRRNEEVDYIAASPSPDDYVVADSGDHPVSRHFPRLRHGSCRLFWSSLQHRKPRRHPSRIDLVCRRCVSRDLFHCIDAGAEIAEENSLMISIKNVSKWY